MSHFTAPLIKGGAIKEYVSKSNPIGITSTLTSKFEFISLTKECFYVTKFMRVRRYEGDLQGFTLMQETPSKP
jgi:hypothetical protein